MECGLKGSTGMPTVRRDLPAPPGGPELREGRGFFPPVLAELDLNSGPSPGPGVLSSLSSGSLAEKTQVQATDQARS